MVEKRPEMPEPATVDYGVQEIRLATTMTGGVSLAIWMGGVAREINLLVEASNQRRHRAASGRLAGLNERGGEAGSRAGHGRPTLGEEIRGLYLNLIDLLDVVVDTDVLSGTSAGGINAVLLAYARAQGKDLGSLRDLWLDLGALLKLLRDPASDDLPSLLAGDEHIYAALTECIGNLNDAPVGPGRRPDTTLFVTTTLLTGEPSRFTDSYGTVVQDVDHRGLFVFTEKHLERGNAAALALAARSSASFPGAFEPSFIPFDERTPAVGVIPARPAMEEFASITRPHWVVDGGLLNNRPIGVLLQKVFDRPAKREVRRVLMYVVPSAGEPPPHAPSGDRVDQPYGLVEALLKDLGSVMNASIANDLLAIRQHNDRVDVRRDIRLQLARLAGRSRQVTDNVPPCDALLSDEQGLLTDYRTREAEAIAHRIIEALTRWLNTWQAQADQDSVRVPQPPSAWAILTPGATTPHACAAAIIDELQRIRWQRAPSDLQALATYDRPAFDGAKAVAIAVLRAAYGVAGPADKEALCQLSYSVHDAFGAPPRVDLAKLIGDDPRPWYAMTPEEAGREIARQYLNESSAPPREGDDSPEPRTLENSWRALANVFTPEPAVLTGLRPQSPDLDAYLDFLRPAAGQTAVARALFALFAGQRAMLPVDAEVEQPVEFIQVSADTRTLLDPNRSTAASKLTGEQLHHFGAFYKRSWRANDWMWGRLDGAGWLVHILLDPQRIRYIADRNERKHQRVDWFLGRLQAIGAPPMPLAGSDDDRAIRDELRYLDDPAVSMPTSLPNTALWLAQSWQRLIAATELPVVAQSVFEIDATEKPSDPSKERVSADAAAWARSVPVNRDDVLTQAGELLRTCPVPKETLQKEIGTPLMIRTVTKTAAVAAGVLARVQQIPARCGPHSQLCGPSRCRAIASPTW